MDHLLAMHFPNPVVIERGVALAAAHCTEQLEWQVAVRVVVYGRVVWEIDSMPHTKVQEWMGYSWPYYKRDGDGG
jgi:uncharacterized protein YraI